VEYDGSGYAGFQSQPGKVTVQSILERAVEAVTQERTPVVGSGRTDAGAHALGQVVAFSSSSTLSTATLCRALNAQLPSDVSVIRVSDMPLTFHPRFDATSRTYRYLIWNRPVSSPFWQGRAAHVKPHLDTEAMGQAAEHLLGTHDYGAFVAATASLNRARTVFRADCRRDSDLVVVELEANGFMRQMVRAIVGTLILVGRGKLEPRDVRRILESRKRERAGDTAPAHGLYLVNVRYGPMKAGASTEAITPLHKETAR
jgi:tRNA pseudouridine38-40 synthase